MKRFNSNEPEKSFPVRLSILAYCSKCGAKNDDNRETCSTCGAELYLERDGRRDYRRKKAEDECFGLPYGGAIAGIIIGAIIIMAGLNWFLDIEIEIWPAIVIAFGLLIVAGAIYGIKRRR